MNTAVVLLAIVYCCLVDTSCATILPDLNLDDGDTTCERLQMIVDSIQCENDGSFRPRQCGVTRSSDIGLACVCVNSKTGERLPDYPPFHEDANYDCIGSFPPVEEDTERCPELDDCGNVCQFGVEFDDDECPTCSCLLGTEEENENEEDGEDGGEEDGSPDHTDGTPTETHNDLDYCNKTCPTVRQILNRGCRRECLVVIDDRKCPFCNLTCNDKRDRSSVIHGGDECVNNSDCRPHRLCLRRGAFGQHSCVNRLAEGEECSVLDGWSAQVADEALVESLTGRSSGALARAVLATLRRAIIPCRDGLLCTRVGLRRKECRPLDRNNACLQDKVTTSADQSCSEEACRVRINGETFTVKHGSIVLDPRRCSQCVCMNGELRFCEAVDEDCAVLDTAAPESCRVEGRGEVQHGDIFKVDCNICGCRNGQLSCTHRLCNLDDENNDDGTHTNDKDTKCLRCQFLRRDPVCAPNGKTYVSRCHAVECVGFSPLQLLPGPCTKYDVCQLYPCEREGEVCIRKGGVSCFNLEGCEPSDVRICVDPAGLVCEGEEGEEEEEEEDECDTQTPGNEEEEEEKVERSTSGEDEDDYICGTNARSYRSLCRLLQDTGLRAQVAHTGKCNARQCQGGPVCGTDGITYENVCLLRSRSGSGRKDYDGYCVRAADEAVVDSCRGIRKSGKCPFSEENCRHLVRPEDGCCPICGGVIVVSIDSLGMSQYLRLNPGQPGTLNALLEQLVEFLNLTGRCNLEGALTNSGNLELVFSAESDDNAEFCNQLGRRVVMKINGADLASEDGSGEGEEELKALPVLLQFMSAALTAPLVAEDTSEEGGSDALASAASCVLVLLASLVGGLL